MTLTALQALSDRLIAAGCTARSIAIEGTKTDSNHDVDRLYFRNGEWVIEYWERGRSYNQPIFKTSNLNEAIVYYESHLMKRLHLHLIARTKHIKLITRLEDQLNKINIDLIRNDLPASQFGQPIYRLYVKGLTIFTIEEKFGRRVLLDDA